VSLPAWSLDFIAAITVRTLMKGFLSRLRTCFLLWYRSNYDWMPFTTPPLA